MMKRSNLSRRACLKALGGAMLGAAAIIVAVPGEAWALGVSTAHIGDVTVLSLRGKIVTGDGDVALRQAVGSAVDSGARKLVLDFGGVTAMDAGGLGELVSAYTTATNRGGQLVLANVPARINDILTITQLASVFAIYYTVDDAVSSFNT